MGDYDDVSRNENTLWAYLPWLSAPLVPPLILTGSTRPLYFLLLALIFTPNVLAFWKGRIVPVFVLYFVHVGSLLGFVALRDLADETTRPVVFEIPILVDQVIGFGTVPTVILQQLFFDRAANSWYDYGVLVTYSGHFAVIWMVAYAAYSKCHLSFCRYMLSSSLTYWLALPFHFMIPTAPPWLAAKRGSLPSLERIFLRAGSTVDTVTVQNGIDVSGNDVAAVPSLHMAITWIMLLLAWRWGPFARALAITYCLAMLWTIVYGAEHYVFDAIAGALLATTAWWLASRLLTGSSAKGFLMLDRSVET